MGRAGVSDGPSESKGCGIVIFLLVSGHLPFQALLLTCMTAQHVHCVHVVHFLLSRFCCITVRLPTWQCYDPCIKTPLETWKIKFESLGPERYRILGALWSYSDTYGRMPFSRSPVASGAVYLFGFVFVRLCRLNASNSQPSKRPGFCLRPPVLRKAWCEVCFVLSLLAGAWNHEIILSGCSSLETWEINISDVVSPDNADFIFDSLVPAHAGICGVEQFATFQCVVHIAVLLVRATLHMVGLGDVNVLCTMHRQ